MRPHTQLNPLFQAERRWINARRGFVCILPAGFHDEYQHKKPLEKKIAVGFRFAACRKTENELILYTNTV